MLKFETIKPNANSVYVKKNNPKPNINIKIVWYKNPDWKLVTLNEKFKIIELNPVGPNCSIKPLSIVWNDVEYPKFINFAATNSLTIWSKYNFYL